MDPWMLAAVGALMFAAAVLYSSVGHGGASGYLAVMALFGVAPLVMRPSALVLNVVVAGIATLKFGRAGCFSWRLFWPFAAASVPASFVGGTLSLGTQAYRVLVGVVLLYAAGRMLLNPPQAGERIDRPPRLATALAAGGAIGLLSGLTGVGGGIFLSPLLLLAGWADPRTASAVAAPFIVANSLAGLLGQLPALGTLPAALPFWAVAVAVGGWLGAAYGSRRLAIPRLRQLLAVVLVIAGIKLLT